MIETPSTPVKRKVTLIILFTDKLLNKQKWNVVDSMTWATLRHTFIIKHHGCIFVTLAGKIFRQDQQQTDMVVHMLRIKLSHLHKSGLAYIPTLESDMYKCQVDTPT